MKKVKWQWDWEVFVPLCPYCNELAYEKDHCVFCKKEYKWKNKSKDRQVTVGEYTVVQASNNHISIFKDGRGVYYTSCTKKLSKRKLKGFVKFYEDLTNDLKENAPKGKTITISKFTYKGADNEQREAN